MHASGRGCEHRTICHFIYQHQLEFRAFFAGVNLTPSRTHSFNPLRRNHAYTSMTFIDKIVQFFKTVHEEALVTVQKPIGVLAMVFNFFVPGTGTLVACVVAGKIKEGIVCFAMMWLMTFVFLVGWVWSVVHGVMIFLKSNSTD
jgi:hypothetical protein